MNAGLADQAAELRRLVGAGAAEAGRPLRAARVFAIASGKGGVGKTHIAVGLALCFAARGRRTLLVDADLGTANADLLLDLDSPLHLGLVLDGRRSLGEVAAPAAPGLRVVVGASGLPDAANLGDYDRHRLLQALAGAESEADVIVIDCGAGISRNVVAFAAAADELLVVATPEPTALTDAYALVKVVNQQRPGVTVNLVVNQARSPREGRLVAERVAGVAARFLGLPVFFTGCIPRDEHVPRAVRQRAAVVRRYPRSPAATAISALAARLDRPEGDGSVGGGFFRKVVGLFY